MTPLLENTCNELTTCLRCACDIFSLMEESRQEFDENRYVSDIGRDQLDELWQRHFGVAFPDAGLAEIGTAVISSLNQHGRTSCAIWMLAHTIDHFNTDYEAMPTQH